MKQKTAIIELIEILEEEAKQYEVVEPYIACGLHKAIEEAKQLLEKEKKQIMDVYDELPLENFNGAEEYYNQTYKQD